jgi:5'-3' exonuclease
MCASNLNLDACPICRGSLDDGCDVIQVRQKGADRINTASTQRGDSMFVTAGSKVHSNCRKRHTDIRKIQSQLSNNSAKSTKRSARASVGPFVSKTDCLFCGTSIELASLDFSYVKTDIFSAKILECCDVRSDAWSFTVKGRIEYYGGDLHAADCLYHHSCSGNFRSGRDVPLQFRTVPEAKRRQSGRPKDEDQEQAFSKMCSYLENNDEEQLTISELRDKMKELLTGEDSLPYGNQYLKSLLKERYGNAICIAEGDGLTDIVTMRERTAQILRSYFKRTSQEGDEESEKRAIIDTAARLVKSDIKTNIPSVTNEYPSTETLKLDSALNYIPDTLRTMLNSMFVGKDIQRKVASIGQAIIQAVRPRAVIAPLQLGLAVQAHHLYRSKFIVDTLCEMGFCSSYGEVLRFEKNAADCVAPDMLGEDIEDVTLLFAADNVDHNIATLDGKGTFHGMGMIAALTPGRKTNQIISRQHSSQVKITDKTKIDIIEYRFATHARRTMKFEKLAPLLDCDRRVDVLWELSFNFKQDVPSWQGMMHIVHQGNEHPGQSSIVYLPMIDMYPGDKSCIVSTLEFLCNLAVKHHVPPIITFDQPLYWKAAEIIIDAPKTSDLKQIVLRLGCFHTFMNLLGAIGTLMAGTGLTKILEVIYGENAVLHMMTGKSVQRSFRGHLLVDKCLNHMMVSDMMDDDPEFSALVDQSEELYTSLLASEATLESVTTSDTMTKLKEKMDKKKTELQERSKTSQLWLNYQKMLQVARALIKADRTGSWLMHLSAVSDCLPIFAAAGHYNYLKSAYFYVQEMSKLEVTHPAVFRKFVLGCHVVRRSNQFWAGLSSDLVIEQTLMRSLKSTGGLTRGSGMTEDQRSLWTLSTPITSEYNNAMQEFSNLSYTTSEQHKESTEARIKRDTSDLSKIHSKLVACTPFSPDPSLRNIVSGVVAMADVNVHAYESVGNKIIDNMIGQLAFTFSFKRKDKAKTLGDVSAVKVAPDRTIDPALLFQRFLVVSKTGELSLEEVMDYELSPFPPALFEARHIFRKADKPQLAHAIIDHSKKVSSEAVPDAVPKTEHYVLDGGSLLHRLPWNKGDSYGAIAQSYADFTIRHYGSATVVFDGYGGGPSIKDNTHQRRGQNIHPVVSFTAETEFSGKKDEFLSRDSNKQGLIDLISDALRNRDCNVINAQGDADVDIVKAAVEASYRQSTTLIGEDTDLLILLLYHARTDNKDLYFRSDNQSKDVKVYYINRLKEILDDELCSQLLFIHAFTGCDTTSRVFGIGKKSAFQKLVKGDPTLKSCANTFLVPSQKGDVIEDIGSQAMAVMFGGKCTDSLALVRYNMFTKKVVSSKSFVTPERLAPTASSTKFHCLRSYYQIMVWIGSEGDMDVTNWGWNWRTISLCQ